MKNLKLGFLAPTCGVNSYFFTFIVYIHHNVHRVRFPLLQLQPWLSIRGRCPVNLKTAELKLAARLGTGKEFVYANPNSNPLPWTLNPSCSNVAS
jgi:hypothetical protein